MIDELKKRFQDLKNQVRKCLEKRQIHKTEVADVLTSLSPDEDEQHKIFAESHVAHLFGAANISEQFGTMNFHWNYINPPLLDHLVEQFNLEDVRDQMETYKRDLKQFRVITPLKLYCLTQKRKRIERKEDFNTMVARFDWQENITLEDVEEFRQEYASEYNLHRCAMMIAQVLPGSYIITWFIPESIINKLMENIPEEILIKYCVTQLEIAGFCIYSSIKTQKVSVRGYNNYMCLIIHSQTGSLCVLH